MASITTWMRLEPHSRAADMQAGLEMRIHDPLWLLARQWQFGEFQGEDTGSPIWAALSGSEMPISLYVPGSMGDHADENIEEYLPNVPLEYLIENEHVPAVIRMSTNRRLAVEAGQHFLRLLGETLAEKYRTHLLDTLGMQEVSSDEQTTIDAASLAFLDWMTNRAIDGLRLLAALQPGQANDAIALGFEQSDAQAANDAVVRWKKWCEKFIGPLEEADIPQPSWNPDHMEYSCTLAAPMGSSGDQILLEAKEYLGGHLEWYSFDATFGQKLNREITSKPITFTSNTIPTNLTFKGMPANRLWEFEDAQVRLGSIQAAPTDLARMLLVEFLITYGNDFFKIPIELKAGSLFHVDKLTLTNTFGEEISSLPFADQEWRLFALSTEPDSDAKRLSSALFLPPVLEQGLESLPMEEVHLLRDEMANISWAIENTVESKGGKPLNRHEAFQTRRQREDAGEPPVAEGTLVYRLDTSLSTLPDYWIPLLPEQVNPKESPLRLLCVDQQGNIQGQLLSELIAGANSLFDQEVPRMGANVRRAHQYSRWYEGGLVSWIGREKRPGRGESSSGLRHDIVEIAKAS